MSVAKPFLATLAAAILSAALGAAGSAAAQSAGELRPVLKSCLRVAVLEGNLEKAPVDGVYEVVLTCGDSNARDLYVAMGYAGVDESLTQFVDRERGLTRRFGKSACFQITQNAAGEPRQDFHCRIVLDVGPAGLRAF